MAAWDSEDVIACCPELATTPAIGEPTFAFWIGVAERQINPDAFGDRVVEAGAFLTAHHMLRAGLGLNGTGAGGAGAAAGAVSGISVGKVSVSFQTLASQSGGNLSTEEVEFLSTRPGAAYLNQVRLCVATPIVLGSDIPGVL